MIAPIEVCIDRVLPAALESEADDLAIRENPANDPTRQPATKLALRTGKTWKPGRTLRIRFLDGSTALQVRVIRSARRWTEHANLVFDFGAHEDAEIRISFLAGPGAWSALGTDALLEKAYAKYQPTMNFGWLRDDTPEERVSRVVLHEFGHALGCVHEHASPAAGIKWNKAKVYERYAGPPNHWSQEQIDRNVLAKYSASMTQFSAFDPASIMLYPIPAELTEDGISVPLNTTLSANDIAFIGKMYPR